MGRIKLFKMPMHFGRFIALANYVFAIYGTKKKTKDNAGT